MKNRKHIMAPLLERFSRFTDARDDGTTPSNPH